MEAREMIRGGPLALNSVIFSVWAVFFTAAVSKHVGAKHVLNMAIPEEETDKQKNKRICDFGNTNDLVFSLLIKTCFKHPEAMLVAADYTKGWANELLTILKERFGRVDRPVTHSMVEEFTTWK